MRYALFFPILLAGTCAAQGRHAGVERPATAPSVLARDMLTLHNGVRSGAGVAPLAWSDRLAAVAHAGADNLIARRQFGRGLHSSYGENLSEIGGAPASPEQVVDAWAGESRNYDYASNACRGVCGHYTQI